VKKESSPDFGLPGGFRNLNCGNKESVNSRNSRRDLVPAFGGERFLIGFNGFLSVKCHKVPIGLF
jgi:hypothetical protein